MKRLFLNITKLAFITSLLVLSLVRCSDSMTRATNNNQLSISIVKSIGDTVTLLAKGDSASYGCSILGAKINGLFEGGPNIELSFLGTPYGCVSSAGTYSLICRYYQDKLNSKASVYSNYDMQNPKGKIIFSKVDEQSKEAQFSVICYCEFQNTCAQDSIQILGTFSANFF